MTPIHLDRDNLFFDGSQEQDPSQLPTNELPESSLALTGTAHPEGETFQTPSQAEREDGADDGPQEVPMAADAAQDAGQSDTEGAQAARRTTTRRS